MQPGLLVSVRNASEAISAWRGGADIIDLKEPLNGPLGAVPAEVPVEVLHSLQQLASSTRVMLSVALGETREWQCSTAESTNQGMLLRELKRIASGLQFLKIGLSTDPASLSPRSDEILERWAEIRGHIDHHIGAFCPFVDEPPDAGSSRMRLPDTSHADSRWVAVAYADSERSGAPSVTAVLEAAIQTGCRGLLIDTYLKDGHGLFTWCSSAELIEIRNRTREAGLFLALAGQITPETMVRLKLIQPDVIAVRGSVCRSGLRALEVDEDSVRSLKLQILATF